MRSRNVRRTQDEGRRTVLALAALSALGLFVGCDWLLGTDTTPPTCRMVSPADSALVNGMVPVAATATDSVGVVQVEFYADGALVGADSFEPYSASWDASGQSDGSWHSLCCVAYDLAGNKGHSDTVKVEIAGIGQTSVFHGEARVAASSDFAVPFDAESGDTLIGDALVVSGGTLSSLMWLDRSNYQKYAGHQSYTTLFQQDSFSQMSMTRAVASAGRFYLVFVNNTGSAVTCWARFVLE